MISTSIVEVLRQRALQQPEKVAYTFLEDGEDKETNMSYGQLDHKARSIAALLNQHQVYKRPVLLLYPSGLDYIAAFFGCLYAGAIAVPAYPPQLGRSLSRLYSVLTDSQPAAVLISEAIRSGIDMLPGENAVLKALNWITTDSLDSSLADKWQSPAITSDSVAFLQYTSGSTSSPKGVIVTHGNLIHNEEMIRATMKHTEQSTFVGWLPLYHDMGLIGNVMHPLYIGARCVLMSPEAFLQRPYRWLNAISRYRGVTSGGPNFAYELCARKISPTERKTLDLSSWTTAFNGAEPVRHETLDRFADAFASCGFRREALYPCYGLAEATLFVAGEQKPASYSTCTVQKAELERNIVISGRMGEPGVQTIVSCGQSFSDQKIAIVDPNDLTQLPSGQVGEIWIAGPSVTGGYWGRPEETSATFHAHIKDSGEGPFLRTGDLGFLLDGHLFVTGRLKDLIILRGRNHYPQDIELTVERSHEGLRPGRGAAFSAEAGGEERLVVVQEVDSGASQEADSIVDHIRQAIAEEHEIQTHSIVLVTPGSVPKTSSGKLQRQACREAYLNGKLDKIIEWQSGTGADSETIPANTSARPQSLEEVEAWLQSSIAISLKLDRAHFDMAKPLAALGADSLTTIEIMHRIETELGVSLSISELLQCTSISHLAAETFSRFVANAPAVVRAAQDTVSVHPLSYGQRSLFFLNQLEPTGSAYNIARAVRVVGDLDTDSLKEAFRKLVERHAALRTTFTVKDGEPVQHIHARMEILFQQQDAFEWGEKDLEEHLVREANQPFDLARGPLLRVKLFALQPQRHIMLLVIHHIISDFWSLAVLMNELRVIYEALAADRSPVLQPLKIRYTDYTRWQSELMSGQEGERLWSYWKRQLGGNLPVLNLPLDKPRTAINEQQGASQSVRFDASLTQSLKQLSQQENATLYMTLLAVLQTLLYRYTGQDDFLIGSPTTGRSRAEFTDLMGYLVNPVILRADLSAEPTFKQVLERVRQNVLAAFEHQEYPFALLVEKLQPNRTVWSLPLLQVMFVMQKAPSFADGDLTSFAVGESGGCFKLGESILEAISLDQQAALFDLTWTVAEVDSGLSVMLQYRKELFEASTIRRMLTHFDGILTALVEDPDISVLALPLLADAEEEPLLKARHNLDAEASHASCLQKLFEEQVRSVPDAVAVSFEGDRLTYDELNRKANQLAHHLRQLGVGSEVLVGLFAERSLDLVVSILAILKAGGAYMPLDPSYPQERLAFMIADAGIALLLTEHRLKERLPEHPAPVIFLDKISADIFSESDENPNLLTSPGNLAYVIYTSGSTGKPKGTEVTHANVTRLFAATDSWFQFGASDVWTLFHSYAFDFSVWEIWGALLRGGRLVVVPYWISRSPEAFFDLLEQEAVTVLNQTPPAFRQLVHVCESFEQAKQLNLRLVIFGGEALDIQTLQPWFERYGDQHPQLVNMYGITETTVHVTYRPLKKDDLDAPGGSRIGVPIPDLQLHILDARMRPVPIGVVGEMYVGGDGVARGYLNRPELTLERFLPDPFTGKPGARLYRTGDLARCLPDDDVEYVGRIDEQVKIRGFRIEMREIQLAILQHSQVRDAVITVIEDSPGDKRLVAYVVPHHPDEPPAISELQLYLREKLADYMVPSLFVIIDELPLTPHGKLNRHALPVPEGTRSGLNTRFSAPVTETEALLAEIWTQALGVNNVGIDDNFFDLGGDSIRSIQVKSRAEQRGLNFSIQQMFQNPTIRQLAKIASLSQPVIGQCITTQPFSLISAQDRARLPLGLEDAYPLTKLQMGLVFHSERSADYETYVTSMHLRMPLDMQLLQNAVDRLVARHFMLRTSFNLSSYSVPLQLVHQSVSIQLKFDDLRHLSDEQQEQALSEFIKNERGRRFDWSQCPLFELHVHRRGSNTLQFTLSEPFLDGWSVASLLTELFTIYLSLLESGDYSSLPLEASFRDYVALEIEALRSSASREYWLTKMQGYTRRQLPCWPASSQSSDELAIERLNVSIPAEVSAGLQGFARQIGVPIKAALLAAHMKVLSFLTGEQDVVTGLLYNGRPEVMDGDRVLGLFLNALPMRLSLHSGTWADLARAAFEAEQEALPFRLYPLAEIQRQCGGQPLFDLAFNFTHFHVYQNLRELGRIEVLGGYASDQTFFNLTVQFNLNYASSTVSLALDYRADRFSHDQMIAMGGYYQRAISEMIAAPNGSIVTSLLSAQEQDQILFRWNDTSLLYEDTLCLHEMIEDQAARTPSHIALIFEGQSLTYQELNSRANQVAHYLIGLNIGPGALAGIYLERSLDMVVGLLGILKAGGAYVPLDPSYPRERLAFMIEDAKLRVILTTKDSALDLPARDAQTVILDAETAITPQPCTNPPRQATPDDLAYVIYTSGSTGVPKGVQIQHEAVVNFMQSMKREPGLTGADTLLAVTTLSFDIAALEIFLPLITGAKVVIATRATATNGYELSKAISESGATVMQATPTTWRLLLEAGWNGKAGFAILCGGESLPQELASRLIEKGGSVWNLYGPTETTIWSTVCRLESLDGPVTIGRPIANTQIYLLDKSLSPVPVGTPGELYIGGRGLSSGYINRADLTAERFIPDPFAEAPGKRIYRTGDIARYLPDGRIEILGRADQQVKIRGYRIEPAEIEAVMQKHSAIEQSAVIAVENDDKSKRLVAYIVFAQGMPLSAAEIRNFLRQYLPKHAIPVSFVALDSMPLTPNGKIDRNKLPLTKASQELPKEAEELLQMIEGLSADEVRALLQRKKSSMTLRNRSSSSEVLSG